MREACEDVLPDWFYYLALGLFGLVFGSFGNVVIWRLPRGESLSAPPSHCPHCDSRIAWYDNIPVLSWVLLRARCRGCGAPISARYPAVELLSAVLWISAGWRFGQSLAAIPAILFFYVLLLLAFIDWDSMRLPDVLTLPLGGVGFLFAIAAQWTGRAIVPLTPVSAGLFAQPILAAVAGSVLAAGIAWGIAAVYGSVRKTKGFGFGDVKLLAAMGPYLGLYGVIALFFGSILGAAYGLIAIAAKKLELRTKFPFGPFLAAAGVLTALFGPAFWQWYAGLFHL